jgi:hypothetical protein
VYPPPRPAFDVKSFPCGDGAVWATGPITTLQPGVNEVTFDEFICHPGDMVRIALSQGSDDHYDNHVLLDRLPHNDLCSSSSQRHMAVNITLPSHVDCSSSSSSSSQECSLQIIQVMASKFRGSTCANPTEIPQNCGGFGRMYYSCARIVIDNTNSGNDISNSDEIDNDMLLLPPVFHDFYGATSPVDYEWPLTADWCRNNEQEPWRLCDPTPQAVFEGIHSLAAMTDITNEDDDEEEEGEDTTSSSPVESSAQVSNSSNATLLLDQNTSMVETTAIYNNRTNQTAMTRRNLPTKEESVMTHDVSVSFLSIDAMSEDNNNDISDGNSNAPALSETSYGSTATSANTSRSNSAFYGKRAWIGSLLLVLLVGTATVSTLV